jgi:hypothetical protein
VTAVCPPPARASRGRGCHTHVAQLHARAVVRALRLRRRKRRGPGVGAAVCSVLHGTNARPGEADWLEDTPRRTCRAVLDHAKCAPRWRMVFVYMNTRGGVLAGACDLIRSKARGSAAEPCEPLWVCKKPTTQLDSSLNDECTLLRIKSKIIIILRECLVYRD